jgi:tRNA pseudouridine38-40 synthase
LSYDGTDFCGWQRQTNAPEKPSIQGTLENALSKIFKTPISVVASGRTDAGVHAFAQTVHFNIEKDPSKIKLHLALKTLLPPTVSVKRAWLAPNDFHALFSARAKTYRYAINTAEVPSAIFGKFSLWYPHQLSIEKLQQMADYLIGTHDFKSFQSAGTPLKSTTRTIFKAEWTQPRKNLIYFYVTGSGFLKQMVRNIVGTQLLLYKDKRPPETLLQIMNNKDRKTAGYAAAPQGLFLIKVYYPKELNNLCKKIPLELDIE